MKDKALYDLYANFAKFYITFISRTKITLDFEKMDKDFHYIMSATDDYDKEQVDRIMDKKP